MIRLIAITITMSVLMFGSEPVGSQVCPSGTCVPVQQPVPQSQRYVDGYGRLTDASGRPFVDSGYRYLDRYGRPMNVTAFQGAEAIRSQAPATPTPPTPESRNTPTEIPPRPAGGTATTTQGSPTGPTLKTQTPEPRNTSAEIPPRPAGVTATTTQESSTGTAPEAEQARNQKKPAPVPGIDTPYSGGWIPHPEETREFVNRIPVIYSHQVTERIAEDDDSDRFLYRYVVRLAKDAGLDTWITERNGVMVLRSYNQGSVGSCVGNAAACVTSTLAACEIVMSEKPQKFVAFASAEGLYGLGRERAGMLNSSGDGCYGSAMAEAVCEYGTLWCLRYDSIDLTTYDASRCRTFGSRGVGDILKQSASEHLILNAVHVRTAREAWALIGSGYPIVVCSNVGFQGNRNEEGMIEPRGMWNHAMAITARRTSEKYGRLFLIQNSWGDTWNPKGYAGDEPQCSFWVRESVVETMLQQGDSFAYSGLNGFRRRTLPDLGTIYP